MSDGDFYCLVCQKYALNQGKVLAYEGEVLARNTDGEVVTVHKVQLPGNVTAEFVVKPTWASNIDNGSLTIVRSES